MVKDKNSESYYRDIAFIFMTVFFLNYDFDISSVKLTNIIYTYIKLKIFVSYFF